MFTKRNIPQRQLYLKALSLNIPKQYTHTFVGDVLRWEQYSGIDWTVDRLKSIKQDLINYYNTRQVPITKWVARGKDHMFNGVLGKLFQYAIKSERCFDRVLSLVNIYTSYVFSEPRPKDLEKFRTAVETPAEPVPTKYQDLIMRSASKFRTSRIPESNTSFELELTTPSREYRFMHEPRDFFKTTDGIRTYCKFHGILDESLDNFIPRHTGSPMHFLFGGGKDAHPPYIGEICVTPNPGLKARFYAAPHLWLQHTLKPLGRAIYNIVNELPWDCTFDQNKANDSVHKALSNNEYAYCFDLTSATDRFPFSLQLNALRHIFTHSKMLHYVDYYEWMQSMPYKFDNGPLIWARGQALGMYPSFGTFTLTHGLMLYALNNYEHNDEFFVLGDDVIILNKELASKYELFLQECSIEFSPSKTIVSNQFAEFAGMLFHKNYKYRIPKWKPIDKVNVIDQIRTWGLDIIQVLPKSKRDVLLRIAQLPYPWGCDLNPNGLSLDTRLLGMEEIFTPSEKDLGYFTNYRSLLQRRFYEVEDLWFAYNPNQAVRNAEILDQRIQSIVSDHKIPILGSLASKNLYSIDPDLNLDLDTVGKKDRSPQTSWSSWVNRITAILK